jgi:hypothetical protein
VHSQIVYNQPLHSPTTVAPSIIGQPSQPVASSSITQTQTITARPTTSTTTTPSTVIASKPIASRLTASVQTANRQSIQQSALQALAAIGKEAAPAANQATSNDAPAATIPEFTAASPNATDSHLGAWRVSLPGNQSVELNLDADGKFVWKATKSGSTSQFNGQYRLADGKLTLVRSADLQQMTGSWTAQKTGFTFKLDGSKTGGLNFIRS